MLKVSDIDSKRMVIRIEEGRGRPLGDALPISARTAAARLVEGGAAPRLAVPGRDRMNPLIGWRVWRTALTVGDIREGHASPYLPGASRDAVELTVA